MNARPIARVLVVASVAAWMFGATPPEAGACSCAVRSVGQELAAADVVFAGVAREVRTNLAAAQVVATFAVSAVYKGSPPARTSVSTNTDSGACGIAFSFGRTYAVFAMREAAGFSTGLCAGTTDDLSVLNGFPSVRPATSPGARAAGSRSGTIAGAAALLVAVAALAALAFLGRRRVAARAARRPGPAASPSRPSRQ